MDLRAIKAWGCGHLPSFSPAQPSSGCPLPQSLLALEAASLRWAGAPASGSGTLAFTLACTDADGRVIRGWNNKPGVT